MPGKLRIGLIGLGGMGTAHMRYLLKGEVEGAELAAVCESFAPNLDKAKMSLPDSVACFSEPAAMFESGLIDGVLIATPHYFHPELAIAGFERGLHVLTEKPAGVYTRQVRLMNEAAAKSGKVFGIMYNLRLLEEYKKLKELVDNGELGEIRRTNWIITDWYRKQSYYDSGSWRGTWAGEGGGVLMNQDPHQLDLWQWTIGMMPSRVRAFCYFGKRRRIEVEDEVTAYVEYENGATGVFVTTTAEAPGTNRYEVAGDRGKAVIEDGKLTFWRLTVPESQFNSENRRGAPEAWKIEIPVKESHSSHQLITQNWVDAILHGKPLIAPGEEGIKGLTLCNAMYLSTWTNDWVDLPIDEDLFYEKLQERKGKD